MKYEVIEDDGGGLTLIVFGENKEVVFAHTGYEYVAGHLMQDLKDLAEDGDTSTWDGNIDDPQAFYDELTNPSECGWWIVADNDGIYPEKMGAAASEEFGII